MTAEDLKISQEPRADKRRVLLTSWAAVASALFVFTLIFGAVYVVNIQPKCDNDSAADKDNNKNVQVNVKDKDQQQKEEVTQNNEKHTDFIIKKTEDGDIELLAGVNYNTKISTCYLPRENVCVLSSGDDMDWYEDIQQYENATVDLEDKEGEVYNINFDSKVTDMTLLTSEMQIFCRGKDMYWAEKGENEEKKEVATRKKRGYCYRCYYYYYCCWWRVRVCRWRYCGR